MTQPLTIIGSYVSPYVRKVLACMNLKGLPFEVDPITPFYGNEEFRRLSPLCRIPVLIDGDFSCSDSSVICAYLDEAYPGHPLFPADPKDRARARWFEEFADTRLGDVFIWGLFYQKIVHPLVWGEPGDAARIDKSLDEDIPAALDYLEARAAGRGLPVRRHRRRRHQHRQLLPQWRLRRLQRRRGAVADYRRRSSSERSPIRASPTCCGLRTCSATPTSRAGARLCSTPVRGSPKRPWACANRARG